MKPHVCDGNNWPRLWRMILALSERDEDAYQRVMSEIRNCPDCLVDALTHAVRAWAADTMLRAGGLDKAADMAAEEIARHVML